MLVSRLPAFFERSLAAAMVFERIEELKHDYTDKYVVVDENRPELLRFKGAVGQVKTVNMSGRALVEFNTFANIGWYDIDLDFLKVVDAPPPPPAEEKKPEKKPAKEAAKGEAAAKPAAAPTGEKKLSPLEMARMQGAAGAKPAAAPAAKTTAEILAAARTKKGEAPAAAQPASKPAPPPAIVPTAGAKADRSKLSVAEILAMARGGAAAPAAPAQAAPVEQKVAEEVPAATPAVATKPAAKAPATGNGPKAGELSVEQIVAWCKEHDAK